jgi:hypothetical protein
MRLDGLGRAVSAVRLDGQGAAWLEEPLQAVSRSLQQVRGPEESGPAWLTFTRTATPPQGYHLRIREDTLTIASGDVAGALNGVRTLVDIWHQTKPRLPVVEIDDFPDMPKRGVFIESFYGSDRMDVEDWTGLVDQLAQLKFNTVGIAVYGCWDLRHDGQRAEFWYLPLAGLPTLESRQTIRTWDPASRREATYTYCPRMFEKDFFAEVVAHARGLGVDVIPLLAGPSHSSLLPRLLPQLSALDAEGRPKNYGYCVTSHTARSLLLSVLDAVIAQHVLPNGITVLGCQADEYYPVQNVDPEHPQRFISPRCECDGCRAMSAGEQLVEYLLMVGRRLAASGIRMFHWHDSLVREGVLRNYVARLTAEDVPAPIVSWWGYSDPLPRIDTMGLETWVSPSPGLASTLFYQDMSVNIESWMREAARVGASGVFAYNNPDPMLHKNYACLADLSWNLRDAGGAPAFRKRWARLVAPDDCDAAYHAYEIAETVLRCYPLMTHLVDHLLPYFSTSPKGVVNYPEDLIHPLSVPSPALTSLLTQVRNTLHESLRCMPPLRDVPGWPQPGEVWDTELGRIADHIDLVLALVELARGVEGSSEAGLEADVRKLEALGIQLMEALAERKAAYLVPAVLREHWHLVSALRRTLDRLARDEALRPTVVAASHPWQF